MPRQPRIEYAGAVYHVMCRGDRGEDVYADVEDRHCFLATLATACMRTGWRVHAYVLMGNHYHLLLETPEANLVAGMRWLQGTYTQRYNLRHGVGGHLFQGRYKALLVESGSEVVNDNYISPPATTTLPQVDGAGRPRCCGG
jgi:putative transposase